MAESNATGAETGKDGTAAGNAEYATKADIEALTASVATIAASLKGLPNTVNKAAQDQLGRQLKALGLTPDVLARIAAPPKPEGEGEEGEEGGAQEPPKPRAGKGGKQPEAGAQTIDINEALKKQAAELTAGFDKRFKALEEGTKTKLAEAERKQQAAERARVETVGMSKARELLSKHVIPETADLAFDALRARGAIHVADDGTPFYRGNPTDEDSQVPFAEGVTEFLKTPGAKVFLPAPKTPGNGGKLLPKTPVPQPNGGNASIHDRLVATLAADGVNVDDAL